MVLNRRVRIEFGPIAFETTVDCVGLAKLGDLTNKPDMRIDDNGVSYTPSVATIHCADGKLHFVLDDIERLVQTISGVRIETNKAGVTITCL